MFLDYTVFLTTHTDVEMHRSVADITLKRQKNILDIEHSPVGYPILPSI